MNDQDFDKSLDEWVAHESGAAPEMRPTAEMYHLVRSRKRARPLSVWGIAGTLAVALVVIAVIYAMLYQPAVVSPPGHEIAYVQIREGYVREKGGEAASTPTPPEKGGVRGSFLLRQLSFQIQHPQSALVDSVDMLAGSTAEMHLTSEQNYRIYFEADADTYAYVFQVTTTGKIIQLFPNEAYSALDNPVRKGGMVYAPAEPNWFYLSADVPADALEGENRIYVIASSEALRELEDLYSRYSQVEESAEREGLQAKLIQTLDALDAVEPQAAVWMLSFAHR
jgi:hypothetical protein